MVCLLLKLNYFQLIMKLALLIGINYQGTESELRGCETDVYNMEKELINFHGYKKDNIKILTTDATGRNIMHYLAKMVIEAYHNRANEIFFHYSGHGSHLKDNNGDETDGRDECIIPVDYNLCGVITDDLLHSYFSYIPETCKCTCIFDCCHSGTILDLEYQYQRDEKQNPFSTVKSNVLLLTGCRDDQTSADALIDQKWQGAMTNAFLYSMETLDRDVTCYMLLAQMRSYLSENGYTQVPQLCSSKRLTNTSIFCSNGLIEPHIILP